MCHLTKWITALLAVVIAISFVGCSERETSPKSETGKPESFSGSVSSEAESVSDEYYPHTVFPVWLDEGKTLAVPDGNVIRYLNLNNRVTKTVELPKESIIGDCGYFFTGNRIFVRGGWDGENYPGNLAALLIDGKWELVNGSIFDGDGKPLHTFLRYTRTYTPEGTTIHTLSDGRTLPVEGVEQSAVERVGWVTDDLVVLDGHNRLFFYRLSTDTLTLADDMSDWMEKYGKFAAYYGIDHVFPYGEGAFYFAHKNEEKSNSVGTVWYADETGAKELFDGQEFQNCMGNETMLVMVAYEGETEEVRKARVSYARTDDLVLHELDMDVSWVNPSSRLSGSLAALGTSSAPRAGTDGFYVLDVKDGTLEQYVPPQKDQQCELLGVNRVADGFQYIYSVFDSGTYTFYRHNSATGQTEQLQCEPYLAGDQSYPSGLAHYIEYAPELFESIELRIRPLE